MSTETKSNEYKLKLYQHFAFILYGNSEVGSLLFESEDMDLLKTGIDKMRNAISLTMFCYKAGIATDTVLQEALRYDGYDNFKIACNVMEQFVKEIGIE